MDAYDYARQAYGVEPKVGQRVRHKELDRFGVVARPRPSQGVMVYLDGEHHASHWHPKALDYDADDRDRLPMWAVYDHPSDFPELYVARRWISLPQPTPTQMVRCAETLPELHALIGAEQMIRLERMPLDDPKILEVWLV